MSYLDLPRLHFSGLFFTGPSTINNIIQNFDPSVPLENQAGQFQQNAGWNALGVAQWWLEECKVLSAVGSNGAAVAGTDAIIGAEVLSPSPKTPMSDGQGGFYDIAKMVDLDPDQQGRSALYGVRISVTLPNGAGVQGLVTIPELRQLNPRIPVRGGSWTAVGNWMGTLQNASWSGDISSSPLLTSLKTASPGALAVKLTVDLHQNNPRNIFTAGDQFCYGRVLGSIGPCLAGELAQVVPGRCLQTPQTGSRAAAPSSRAAANTAPLQARERVAAQSAAIGDSRVQSRSAVAATAARATPDPWNPAFAIVRQVDPQPPLLSIDIGGCILLNAQGTPPTSDGTFEVNDGIEVGFIDLATGNFVQFANGALTFDSQYQQLSSTPKNVMLVKNSGVFTFAITANDSDGYKTNPLAIQVDGTTVAQEDNSGFWIDVSVSSQRLECGSGQSGQSQIMVRKFGNPVVGQVPVTTEVGLVDWNNNGNLTPSTDVSASFGQTDANGLANITTGVNVQSLTLPAMREPLDSQVYYIFMSDSKGQPIGDGQSPALSVLLWNAFQAPANPSWNDIGAIFGAYARLYPGMKSRLDISDQSTVVGSVGAVLDHMNLPIIDPAYMPVTRDLSPSKMAMIMSWLKQVSQT